MTQEPCLVPSLPETEITWADLESFAYRAGEVIVQCDLRRRLSLEAHQQERRAVAEWGGQ